MTDKQDNSGDRNSGNRNSGYYNSGYYNSGNYNSGNYNSGYYNSGNYNSGHYNSGHRNSGHCNSGHYNSGHYNSGFCNSGYRNSGYRNSGHYNSGHCNSGNYNSGFYNSGHYNSGFFCVNDAPVTFFDHSWSGSREEAMELIPDIDLPVCCEWIASSEMSDEEKSSFPNHVTIGGYLKSNPMPLTDSFPIAWSKLTDDEKSQWTSLPNFDAEKFLKITGVDVRQAVVVETSPQYEKATIMGQDYWLVPVTL